jgi:hypothetical protein
MNNKTGLDAVMADPDAIRSIVLAMYSPSSDSAIDRYPDALHQLSPSMSSPITGTTTVSSRRSFLRSAIPLFGDGGVFQRSPKGNAASGAARGPGNASPYSPYATSASQQTVRLKISILEVLGAFAYMSSNGHALVLDAFTDVAKSCYDRRRFEKLVRDMERYGEDNLDFQVATITFINSIINSREELEVRLHLRAEFLSLGIEKHIKVISCSSGFWTNRALPVDLNWMLSLRGFSGSRDS